MSQQLLPPSRGVGCDRGRTWWYFCCCSWSSLVFSSSCFSRALTTCSSDETRSWASASFCRIQPRAIHSPSDMPYLPSIRYHASVTGVGFVNHSRTDKGHYKAPPCFNTGKASASLPPHLLGTLLRGRQLDLPPQHQEEEHLLIRAPHEYPGSFCMPHASRPSINLDCLRKCTTGGGRQAEQQVCTCVLTAFVLSLLRASILSSSSFCSHAWCSFSCFTSADSLKSPPPTSQEGTIISREREPSGRAFGLNKRGAA